MTDMEMEGILAGKLSNYRGQRRQAIELSGSYGSSDRSERPTTLV